MPEEKIDSNNEENTSDQESQNNEDEKNTQDQTNEDTSNEDNTDDGGDVEKDEDQEKSPYDEKLKELEKDNSRKGTALIEKNKKIQDLKKDLENQGFDEDKVNEIVDQKLKEKMGDLGDIEKTKKELTEQLEITKKSNISSALDKIAGDSEGKKKIYKHFFDTQVNKDLSFEAQIEQAKILGDNAMSDEKFQADVKKANENNVNTSGEQGEDGQVLSNDEESFAGELFQTKEGKEEFKRLRKSK